MANNADKLDDPRLACTTCGRRAIGQRAEILDSRTGKTVGVFRCACGQLIWGTSAERD
jgi:hypothetical protein